jgi:hypothetical protein
MTRYTIRAKQPKSYDRFVWSTDEADAILVSRSNSTLTMRHPVRPKVGNSPFPKVARASFTPTARTASASDVVRGQSLATHLVTGPNGQLVLSPEREAIHQQIVDHFLAGAVAPEGHRNCS